MLKTTKKIKKQKKYEKKGQSDRKRKLTQIMICKKIICNYSQFKKCFKTIK